MLDLSLDTRLLRLSAEDHFTLRDACQGVAVLGGTGSGKTSASGKALAAAYLRAKFGGIVMVAKSEEANLWRKYCADNGRAQHVVEFDGRTHGFNFLAYELARHGEAGLNSVVECLMRILEMARAASATPGRPGEAFWEDTTRQILRNTIPVLYAVTGTVRIEDIVRFVRSAPTSDEQMRSDEWRNSSYFFACFHRLTTLPMGDRIGDQAAPYWRDDYASLDRKTRANIVISLSTTLDRFNHGWLRHAYCDQTTIVPELTFHGAIILLNVPALTHNEDGVVAQQLFKYMWQRATLTRNSLPYEHRTRPVFLWADEAQYFVNSYDAEYLSTCRGSRACTVFLSQSLPTYYARMTGENSRDRVHHLLGNFGTKVFHNNACPETNDWAARTIGRTLQQRATFSETEGENSSIGMSHGTSSNRGNQSSYGTSVDSRGRISSSSSHGASSGSGNNWGDNRSRGSNSSTTHGVNEQMDYAIEPAQFARSLRTGGPANGNRVSAIWFQAGQRFQSSQRNWLHTVFQQ